MQHTKAPAFLSTLTFVLLLFCPLLCTWSVCFSFYKQLSYKQVVEVGVCYLNITYANVNVIRQIWMFLISRFCIS